MNSARPLTPLVLNPVTSCWDVFAPACEPTADAQPDLTPRLPTPEERMRRQAQAVAADIVPINVTGGAGLTSVPSLVFRVQSPHGVSLSVPEGQSFDRQASLRRTLSNGDSLTRRPRNLSRRQTVTGLPEDVSPKAPVSVVLPGQFSTVGRPTSSNRASSDQGEIGKEATNRKIRAPRGMGMSSLMAALTSSPRTGNSSSSSDVRGLPRLETTSSLSSESSCHSASYRTLSASSSCCQVSCG